MKKLNFLFPSRTTGHCGVSLCAALVKKYGEKMMFIKKIKKIKSIKNYKT